MPSESIAHEAEPRAHSGSRNNCTLAHEENVYSVEKKVLALNQFSLLPMTDRKTDFLTFNKSSCYSWPRGYEKINHHEPKRHQWNKIVELIWTAHYQAQNSH